MADTDRLTKRALRAIERGEPIHAIELRAKRTDATHWMVEASDQFWLTCAQALRQAYKLNCNSDHDEYEAAYELLVAALGVKLDS